MIVNKNTKRRYLILAIFLTLMGYLLLEKFHFFERYGWFFESKLPIEEYENKLIGGWIDIPKETVTIQQIIPILGVSEEGYSCTAEEFSTLRNYRKFSTGTCISEDINGNWDIDGETVRIQTNTKEDVFREITRLSENYLIYEENGLTEIKKRFNLRRK